MSRLRTRMRGGLSWLERQFAFSSRRNVARAALAAALLSGLTSVLRGQDANWDLRNYHLYGAFALLHERLNIDLAAAQMQSYFNPLIDVPYYLMVMHAPPMLAAFAMGLWHGLCFILAAAIAWEVLRPDPRRIWLAPLLGLAGCLSAVFLSELGTSMGDNTTAPFVLMSLWAILVALRGMDMQSGRWLALSGVSLGAAVALKLTNAPFAVAIGLTMLAMPVPWRRRLWMTAQVTLWALLVFIPLAGIWMGVLWSEFGNPLFPQFNAWFEAPLAASVSVADTRWLPKGVGEALIYPLRFSIDPSRVSDKGMPQIAWALWYLMVLAAAGRCGLARLRRTPVVIENGGNMAGRFVLVFMLLGYLFWLALFGIHRYLVVVELLIPLSLWQLAGWVFRTPRRAERVAAGLVAASILVALYGWCDWRHAGWSWTAFSVEVPPMPQAERTTVLLVGDEPQSWRIPRMPPEAAYVGVANNFPESLAYREKVHALIHTRGGPVHAMLPMHELSPPDIERYTRRARWLRRFSGDDCAPLHQAASRSQKLEFQSADSQGDQPCRLVASASFIEQAEARNLVIATASAERLAEYGLYLDPAQCQGFAARIGRQPFYYQWCVVTPR